MGGYEVLKKFAPVQKEVKRADLSTNPFTY
jgi:hypothetical protein